MSCTHEAESGTTRNNLFINVDNRRIIKRCDAGPDSRTDWDYDGFDWGASSVAFDCLGDHPDLSSFSQMLESNGAAGTESRGIRVDWQTCFASPDLPPRPWDPMTAIPPQHLTLNPSCNAADAGELLPNLNDDYSGSAPDLGAYEIGQALPQYGPRPSEGVAPKSPTELRAE